MGSSLPLTAVTCSCLTLPCRYLTVPCRDPPAPTVTSCYSPFQDVDEEMGPTSVIPGSITAEAHERFNNRDDGGRERVALLREKPNHVGVLQTGDANLIYSRLIHCGGANASTKRRVLFYFSFKAKSARVPAGSLLTSLRREGYTLDSAEQWSAPLTVA